MQDPARGLQQVKVGPGEHHVSGLPDLVIGTVLGSCVAACIRDPVARVGGMNHFMLPESRDGAWGKAASSLRYGNFAMERLINDILLRGGQRGRLEVKLFGGARLAQDNLGIGERNASYVEAYLQAEGMQPLVRQLRGGLARRVLYRPVSGRAFMMLLPHHAAQVMAEEARFGRVLPRRLRPGAVDLFG